MRDEKPLDAHGIHGEFLHLSVRARVDGFYVAVTNGTRRRTAHLSVYDPLYSFGANWWLPDSQFMRLVVESGERGDQCTIDVKTLPGMCESLSTRGLYRWVAVTMRLSEQHLDLLEAAFATERMVYVSLTQGACESATKRASSAEAVRINSVDSLEHVVADGSVIVNELMMVGAEPIPFRAPFAPELHYALQSRGRPEERGGTFQLALREMLHSIRCNPMRYGSSSAALQDASVLAAQWLRRLAPALRMPDDPSGSEPSPPDAAIPWEVHNEPAEWEAFLNRSPDSRKPRLSAARRDLWCFAILPGKEGEHTWHRQNLINPDLGLLQDCANELLDGSVPYSPTAAGALVSGLMFHEVAYLARSITGDAAGRTFFNPLLTHVTKVAYGYLWRLIAALLAWQFADGDHVVLFMVFFALVGLWRFSESAPPSRSESLRRRFKEMNEAYALTLDGVPAEGVLRYAQSLTERGAVWRPKTLEVLALMAKHGSSFSCLRPGMVEGPVIVVSRR
jgi:hypothetical protein